MTLDLAFLSKTRGRFVAIRFRLARIATAELVRYSLGASFLRCAVTTELAVGTD